MKKFKEILLLVSILICTCNAMAQYEEAYSKPVSPRWVAEKGFWVIESNVKNPQSSVVRFYNNERKLIYTEQVEGIALNVKKRKTLMKLKRALDKVVWEWETNGVIKEQGELFVVSGNKQ